MAWYDFIPTVQKQARDMASTVSKGYDWLTESRMRQDKEREAQERARAELMQEQARCESRARLRGSQRQQTARDKQARLDAIQQASESIKPTLEPGEIMTSKMIQAEIASGGTARRVETEQAQEKLDAEQRAVDFDIIKKLQTESVNNAIWNKENPDKQQKGLYNDWPKELQQAQVELRKLQAQSAEAYKLATTQEEFDKVLAFNERLQEIKANLQEKVDSFYSGDYKPPAGITDAVAPVHPIQTWAERFQTDIEESYAERQQFMKGEAQAEPIEAPVPPSDKIWESHRTGELLTHEELIAKFPKGNEAGLDEYALTREAAKQYTTVFRVFGKAITKVPKQLGASILQAIQGQKGASVVDRDWADKFIQDANTDIEKFVKEMVEKEGATTLPIKLSDIAQLPQNIAYSMTSMGAGLGVGVPTAFIPLPGARIAAWTAGTVASGAIAYRMTTYQITQQYLEFKDEEKTASTGKGLTLAEENKLKEDFEELARKYGLWEAVPEALSNLAFGLLLTQPLSKIVGASMAKQMVAKIVGMYGEELLTETITQKGQSAVEVEAGLREGNIGWYEAFREIAPQTFLLTTIMAGSGQIIVSTHNKIKTSLNKEVKSESLRNELWQELDKIIDEKGAITLPEQVAIEVPPVTAPTIEPVAEVKSEIDLAVEAGKYVSTDMVAETRTQASTLLKKGWQHDKRTNTWYKPTKAITPVEAVKPTEQPLKAVIKPDMEAVGAKPLEVPAGFNPNTPIGYVHTVKRPDGKVQLFYRGTKNEVFPNELFASATEARNYFKAMKVKAQPTTQPETTSIIDMETGTPTEFPETTAAVEDWSSSVEDWAEAMEVISIKQIDDIKQIDNYWHKKMLTHDATKAALIDFVRANMPKDIQHRILAGIKLVKTEKSLNRQVARVREYIETNAQKKLQAEINTQLNKVKTVKIRGKVRGVIGAEAHDIIRWVKGNLGMDLDTARATIISNIEAYDAGTKSYEDMFAENKMLGLIGIKQMSATELQFVLDEVRDIVSTGRATWKAKIEANKARRDELRKNANNVITGGKGLIYDDETLPTEQRELPVSKVGKIYEHIKNSQFGFPSLLDKLSKLDPSLGGKSWLSVTIKNLISEGRNAQYRGFDDAISRVNLEILKIIGIKDMSEYNAYLNRLVDDEVNLGNFANLDGKVFPLKGTKDQLMQKYAEMQVPELEATFSETMKWTQEMKDAVTNSLTQQEKDITTSIINFYDGYYDGINKIYSEYYGINLPKVGVYMPISRDMQNISDETTALLKDIYRHASIANSGLKTRTKNKVALRYVGMLDMLVNHVTQMEHFKAFALPMSDMKSIFYDKGVRESIRQFHGADMLKHTDQLLEDLTRDGVDKARINKTADFFRRAFTRAALSKPYIGFKQVISGLAYSTQMPVADYGAGVTDYWLRPIEHYNFLVGHSEYLKTRFKHGFEQNVRYTKKGGTPHTLSGHPRLLDRPLGLIGLGDKFGVIPGAWAVYKKEMKGKDSTAENIHNAIMEVEQVTQRTQPVFELESLSSWQRGGSVTKLAMMFQNQPAQYFRLFADNARNFKFKRTSRTKATYNMLMATMILPMIFQFISDGFKYNKERQLGKLLFGVPNQLLVIGQFTQSAYGYVTNVPFKYNVSPVFATFDEIQKAIAKAVKMIKIGADPTKDVETEDIIRLIEYLASIAGKTTGLPTPYAIQVERAIRDNNPKQLLFSRWVIESNMPEVEETPTYTVK